MHHNAIRRRRNENPLQCAARVVRATRCLAGSEDFESRVLLYLWYAKGRTPEEIADCLDLPAVDVEAMRREALSRL